MASYFNLTLDTLGARGTDPGDQRRRAVYNDHNGEADGSA